MTTPRRMKVPFDSLSLATVRRELANLCPAKIQKIVSLTADSIAIAAYFQSEIWIVLSWKPERAFLGFTSVRPPSTDASPFVLELRRKLLGGRLIGVRTVPYERVAELFFESSEGDHRLVVELMGKHSNVILLDAENRAVCAGKWVGPKLSRRPILPGKSYSLPPVLTECEPEQRLSPFLQSWAEQHSIKRALEAFSGSVAPSAAPNSAPYPLPVSTESVALQGSFAEAYTRWALDDTSTSAISGRAQSLSGLLRKLLSSREHALSRIEQSLDTAARPQELTDRGQLLLAYGFTVPQGSKSVTAYTLEGEEIELDLDPELTIQEQAERLFLKAKRAREGKPELQERAEVLREDVTSLRSVLSVLLESPSAEDVNFAERTARERQWLQVQTVPIHRKEDRPYAGHAIRELLAPGGWRVLYGDNSTANDYLTTKVAKPNDWWLHVRGGPSTHVVILTSNQPNSVSKEAIEFAALVAARHSPSKHSSYVAVDVTLKKYVRKPKGSGPGLAAYTNERTVHVNPSEAK